MALYSHTTRTDGTTLTASIYNADHNNHVNNNTAAKSVGISANAAAMQNTFDPGEDGSENLPSSVKEELEALRHIVSEITGKTYWYETPSTNLGVAAIKNVINDYGATGDGVTDELAAFNAAIADIGTAKNRPIFIPLGTYDFSSTLTYGDSEVPVWIMDPETTLTGSIAASDLKRVVSFGKHLAYPSAPQDANLHLFHKSTESGQVFNIYDDRLTGSAAGMETMEIHRFDRGTTVSAMVKGTRDVGQNVVSGGGGNNHAWSLFDNQNAESAAQLLVLMNLTAVRTKSTTHADGSADDAYDADAHNWCLITVSGDSQGGTDNWPEAVFRNKSPSTNIEHNYLHFRPGGNESNSRCKGSVYTAHGGMMWAAAEIRASGNALYKTREGTAQAGAATTITLAADTDVPDNWWDGNNKVLIYDGTGVGQIRTVSTYVHATKVLTVTAAWDTNPDATSKYYVFGKYLAGVHARGIYVADNALDPYTGVAFQVDGACYKGFSVTASAIGDTTHATDGACFYSEATTPYGLHFKGTHTTAAMRLHENRDSLCRVQFASNQDTDNLSICKLEFWGHDDGANDHEYARLDIKISDNTDGTEDGEWSFSTSTAGSVTAKATLKEGLAMAGATGGDQGSGTVNATTVYDDGVDVTCYPIEAWLDGAENVDLAKWDSYVRGGGVHRGAREFVVNAQRRLDMDMFAEDMRIMRRLPNMPSPAEFMDRKYGVGDWIQRVWEAAEIAHIFIADLNERLKKLEGK